MYSGIGGDDEEERPKKDEKSCRGRRNSFTTFIKCCKRPITYYESRDRGRLVRKLLHSSILSFFSPLRVMMSASVCIPFINLRHTHRHTAHSSSGVRTSQSRWKRNFPNIFFFCFLWFLSLSPPFYCYDYLGSRCVYGSARLSGAGNVSERPLFTQPLP